MLIWKRINIFGALGATLILGSALAQEVAFVGQTYSLDLKATQTASVKVCNLEITLPDGQKIEREVTAPNYETQVDFIPKVAGKNIIAWEGKLKFRGLNTTLGCSLGGNTAIEVTYPKQAQLDEKDLENIEILKQLESEKKWVEAFAIRKQLAEKGHSPSQASIAIRYYLGQGVTKNFSEAYKWASLSSETESSAMNLLGFLYANGYGVKQDCDAAIRHYKLAIDKNNVTAMFNLGRAYITGRCTPLDVTAGMSLLLKAADLRNQSAALFLGEMNENGIATAVNFDEARNWYQKARNLGSARADELLKRLDSKIATTEESRRKAEDEARISVRMKELSSENERKRLEVEKLQNEMRKIQSGTSK